MPKGKQPFTQERANYYVAELRSYAVKLAEVARQMKEEGFEEMPVMSQTVADIGLGYFHSLVASCERELKNLKLKKRNSR